MPYLGYGIITCCLFVMFIIHAMIVRGGIRSTIVFRHIGLVVQQNMPLSAGLYYAALSESGPARGILARASRLVEAGVPLSQALSTAYPDCPALPLSIIRAGEASATLPSALRELNQRLSRGRLERPTDASYRWILLAIVALTFSLVYSYYCYSTLPKLSMIVADFGVTFPPLVQDVIAANPFSPTAPTTLLGGLYIVAVAGAMLLAPCMLVGLFVRMRPRRVDRVGVFSVALDYVKWHVWPFRGIAVAQSCANAIPILRVSVAAGWPLPAAIRHAAAVDMNHFSQRCWQDWSRRIGEGTSPVQAGKEAGLPEVLLRNISVGVRDGDLDAPLYHAEEYYATLAYRWHRFLFQLLWPCATLWMGVIVGGFCLALIVSLKTLIDASCMIIANGG